MAAQLIAVVRHARAGEQEAWRGNDDLRPLSERGCLQADRLAAQLGVLPQVVLSSPSLRCMATVLPLARTSGVSMSTADELYEGGSGGGALWRLIAGGISTVVGCTHGDVVADLLDELLAAGVSLSERRAEKGSTWLLETADGVVRSARYLPPPA